MTNQAAYARYHSLYDNDQYRTVNQLVAEELAIKHDSKAASDVANLITDAALGLCGHDALQALVTSLRCFVAQIMSRRLSLKQSIGISASERPPG